MGRTVWRSLPVRVFGLTVVIATGLLISVILAMSFLFTMLELTG